jgi:hypothetical protein
MTEETLTIPEELCHASPFFDALAKSDMKNEVSSEVANIVGFCNCVENGNIKMYEIDPDYLIYLAALTSCNVFELYPLIKSDKYKQQLITKMRGKHANFKWSQEIVETHVTMDNIGLYSGMIDDNETTLFEALWKYAPKYKFDNLNANTKAIENYKQKLQWILDNFAVSNFDYIDTKKQTVLMRILKSRLESLDETFVKLFHEIFNKIHVSSEINCHLDHIDDDGLTAAMHCAKMHAQKTPHFVNLLGNKCNLKHVSPDGQSFLSILLNRKDGYIPNFDMSRVAPADLIPNANIDHISNIFIGILRICYTYSPGNYITLHKFWSGIAKYLIENYVIDYRYINDQGQTCLQYADVKKMGDLANIVKAQFNLTVHTPALVPPMVATIEQINETNDT